MIDPLDPNAYGALLPPGKERVAGREDGHQTAHEMMEDRTAGRLRTARPASADAAGRPEAEAATPPPRSDTLESSGNEGVEGVTAVQFRGERGQGRGGENTGRKEPQVPEVHDRKHHGEPAPLGFTIERRLQVRQRGGAEEPADGGAGKRDHAEHARAFASPDGHASGKQGSHEIARVEPDPEAESSGGGRACVPVLGDPVTRVAQNRGNGGGFFRRREAHAEPAQDGAGRLGQQGSGIGRGNGTGRKVDTKEPVDNGRARRSDQHTRHPQSEDGAEKTTPDPGRQNTTAGGGGLEDHDRRGTRTLL